MNVAQDNTNADTEEEEEDGDDDNRLICKRGAESSFINDKKSVIQIMACVPASHVHEIKKRKKDKYVLVLINSSGALRFRCGEPWSRESRSPDLA